MGIVSVCSTSVSEDTFVCMSVVLLALAEIDVVLCVGGANKEMTFSTIITEESLHFVL